MGYPAIDQPAPAIEVSEWISGKPEEENGFSGKNVILEFWGTHCGPCIAAIPHLNELVATYGSKDALFVSLTTPLKVTSRVLQFLLFYFSLRQEPCCRDMGLGLLLLPFGTCFLGPRGCFLKRRRSTLPASWRSIETNWGIVH